MGKTELSPKVKAIYEAIVVLFAEGADLNSLTVSEITTRAGIGKGTAYEYFANKEEMIAGALFYGLIQSCEGLEQQMNQKENLYDKMWLLLNNMKEHMGETNCFFRIMHVMQDNSLLSGKMQEMLLKKDESGMRFTDLIRRMLEKETGEVGEERRAEFMYLYMTIFSKIICFGMYLFDEQAKAVMECQQMQEMICKDVCKIVAEF